MNQETGKQNGYLNSIYEDWQVTRTFCEKFKI